jgi:type I restriction enzyme M protein
LTSGNLGKSEDKEIDCEAIDDAGEPNQNDGVSEEQEEDAEENEIAPIVREIYANATTFIKKPATLTSLVIAIDKLDWYSARQEGLGDLYEGLLQKNAEEKKSGAGQYFTPRLFHDNLVEGSRRSG